MRNAIDWQRRAREWAVYIAIGTFLAFVEPFDSGPGFPFWRTWLFWVGLVIIGSLIGTVVVDRIFERMTALPVWAALPLVATTVAIPMTPIVSLFGVLLEGMIPFRYWPQLFIGVWIICVFMTGIGYLTSLAFQGATGHAPAPANNGTIRSDFLSRLPPKFRGAELRAVASEDHYLRIYTDKGDDLILMRLADAVKELSGGDGLQTHRSWWIARDAVAEVRRENGRIILRTHEGVDVPVSRTYAPRVKEAGLT